jgi:alkanesulfonate monooxygenase SsuD/methylene tetrahydromethanopterin reductase-like flavin-dependent oxidoreductase (luciferase family)
VKFLAITLIVHAPDPLTGVQKSTTDRFREVIGNALLAEELGFDGFGVGERHERPFISSSPPVVLSHIAALTNRIRLFTAVTTLSLLDPVRAYEDYATLDHLSGGRLELIIGKGAPPSASCSASPPRTSGTATRRATSCSARSGGTPP